jgi:hypothetical protein
VSLVLLPSGATAPLEVPSLPSLLAAGGDVAALASCAFAHEEVEVAELYESDRYFVASWAVDAFADSGDGLEIAIVADAWGRPPSAYVGLTDRTLCWALDSALYLRLMALRKGERTPTDEDREDVVRFSTPEPEEVTA